MSLNILLVVIQVLLFNLKLLKLMTQVKSRFEINRKFFHQILDCWISYFNPVRGEFFRKFNPFL